MPKPQLKRSLLPNWADGSGQGIAPANLRMAARESLLATGLPTRKWEDWRHISLDYLMDMDLEAVAEPSRLPLSELEAHFIHESWTVVMINGYFQPALSNLEGLPKGVLLQSLAEGDKAPSPLATLDNQPFVALNTASFRDVLVIHISPGTVLDKPLHILSVSASEGPSHIHPRITVRAEADSQAQLILHDLALGQAGNLVNTVIEVWADDGAVVDITALQDGTGTGTHIHHFAASLERSASLIHRNLSFGSRLVRNDIRVLLNGPGASVSLDGLYLAGGRQTVDNHTWLEHTHPNTTSTELYKGILDGHSHGIFNGRVVVARDAQKIDASQSNRNLMLSDKALVNTNPQLEIYADDVKCTHGSTVGQLDEDALFYIRSRGIGPKEAYHLLVSGFAGEIIGRLGHDPLRETMEKKVSAWLARAN